MFKVLPETNASGFHLVELTDGEFKGIVYSYSKVSFKENKARDQLVWKFEYDLAVGEVPFTKKEAFKKVLGDNLMAILEQQLDEGTAVYHGGTNRLE
jgi:hypothetical protein